MPELPAEERTCKCGWRGTHRILKHPQITEEIAIPESHRAPCGLVCAHAFPPDGLKKDDRLHGPKNCTACKTKATP